MPLHKEIIRADNSCGGRGKSQPPQPSNKLCHILGSPLAILIQHTNFPGITLQMISPFAPGRRFGQIPRSHHRPKVPA